MRQLLGAKTVVMAALLVLLSASTPAYATTGLTVNNKKMMMAAAASSANATKKKGGSPPSSSSSGVWGVAKDSDGAIMDIPARKMWGWGPGLHGYCGSMSFQMAGLFNGNYISQERVRYAAGDEEVLVGSGNAAKAAKALGYEYSEWKWAKESVPQSKAFVEWAREEVDKGHVVITGWYERQPHGDVDYDHIMPVVGYTLDSRKDKVDGLYRYDLYLDSRSLTSGSNLHSTRKECSQDQDPVQPYEYCLPDDYDYAVSIHSVTDTNEELYRMKLVAPDWWEPDYGKEDKLHQTVVDFTFKAVVTGLTSGEKYTILRFDSPSAVPSKKFKEGSYSEHQTFTADKATMEVSLLPVSSDGTWFYRTVKGTV